MTPEALETIYEALAEAIDAVGETDAPVFLAKVALALAETLDDRDTTLAIIEGCKRDL